MRRSLQGSSVIFAGRPLTILLFQDEMVNRMATQLKMRLAFTPVQEQWLMKIANRVKANLILDLDFPDDGYFRDEGGLNRLNQIFNENIEPILRELREAALGQE